jgi:peroxiredoxin Q/BCP
MKKTFLVALIVLLAAIDLPAFALEIGEKAPDFEAASTTGTVRLSDFLGKQHVLLAFYFKDFTGG